MESSEEDIELINRAIQKLLDETRIKDSDNDDDQLLSRLFSQLESLKSTQNQSEPEEFKRDDDENNDKAEAKGETGGSGCDGIGAEELVKELKAIKKQNTITHFLVSAMIIVTLIWQVSEASLLLKVSNGVAHPFKSLGSWLLNKLKRPIKQQEEQVIEAASSGSGLSVRIPELPNVEFPHLGSTGEGH